MYQRSFIDNHATLRYDAISWGGSVFWHICQGTDVAQYNNSSGLTQIFLSPASKCILYIHQTNHLTYPLWLLVFHHFQCPEPACKSAQWTFNPCKHIKCTWQLSACNPMCTLKFDGTYPPHLFHSYDISFIFLGIFSCVIHAHIHQTTYFCMSASVNEVFSIGMILWWKQDSRCVALLLNSIRMPSQHAYTRIFSCLLAGFCATLRWLFITNSLTLQSCNWTGNNF